MDELAPVIVMVTLILTTAGVILLRPVSKQLAEYIRTLNEQNRLQRSSEPAEESTQLAALQTRLSMLEERQRFTEALLAGRSESAALNPSRPPQHEWEER